MRCGEALLAQEKLSPRLRKDLAENAAARLDSLGDQLLPREGVA